MVNSIYHLRWATKNVALFCSIVNVKNRWNDFHCLNTKAGEDSENVLMNSYKLIFNLHSVDLQEKWAIETLLKCMWTVVMFSNIAHRTRKHLCISVSGRLNRLWFFTGMYCFEIYKDGSRTSINSICYRTNYKNFKSLSAEPEITFWFDSTRNVNNSLLLCPLFA